MKRTWTIVGVADVARSCSWYQSLFGQPESAPAHDYFGQIVDTDGFTNATANHLGRVVGVGGQLDLEPFVAQEHAVRFEHLRLVVDPEDGFRRLCHAPNI